MHTLRRQTSRQGAEGRLAILRAARRLFSERGFRGVSLDDVAREAGASKGLVLYHFVTKDRLFAYVIGEVKEELFSRLQAALMGQAGAKEKLLALITVYLRLARSQRRLWRIALHEAYGLGGVSRQLLLDCRQSSLGMISSVLEEGMERGECWRRVWSGGSSGRWTRNWPPCACWASSPSASSPAPPRSRMRNSSPPPSPICFSTA